MIITVRKRHLISLAAAWALLSACSEATFASESVQEKREWTRLMSELPQRWSRPEELARQTAAFAKRHPQSGHLPVAVYLTGEAFRRQGNWSRAAEKYEQFVNQINRAAVEAKSGRLLDSGFEDSAYYRLGECRFNLQQYPQAGETWQYCLARYPGTFLRGEIWHGLGQSLLSRQRWDEAGRQYAQLAAQYPAYTEREDVALAMSTVDFRQGKLVEAIKRLANPETLPGQYLKGRVLQAMEKYVDAANYFNRVVKSGRENHPLFKNAYYLRGEAFLQAKDYASAHKSNAGFLEHFPPNDPFAPYVKFKQAVACFQKGQYGKAEQTLAGLASNPALPRDYLDYLSAECMIRGGRLSRAEAIYGALTASKEPEVRRAALLKAGWCAFLLKRYPEALQRLQGYVASNPGDEQVPALQYLQGRCEELQRRDEAALKIFQGLVERDSGPLLADLSLLRFQAAAERMGRTDALIRVSEQYLNRAGKRAPEEAKAARALGIFRLGKAYFLKANYSRSIELFQRIVDDFWDTPAYPYALAGIVRSFFVQKNYDGTVKSAQSALKEKALPAALRQDLQLLLAHAFCNQKKYEEAVANYQKWMKQNPDSPLLPQILYLTGRGYVQLKFYKNALEVWARLVSDFRKHPACEQALRRSAEMYLDGREYRKSVRLYEQLLADWPQTAYAAQARYAIAQNYLALEDYAAAKSALEAFLQQHPGDARAAESAQNLEAVAFKLAVKTDGPEELDAFAERFPASSFAEKARYRLGEIYFGREQYARAIAEFEKVLRDYPGGKLRPQACYLIGECADALRDTATAVANYEAFVKNYSGHELLPEVLFRLAVDYFQAKDYPAAIRSFKDIADRFPKSKNAPQALYNLSLCYGQLQRENDVRDAMVKLAEKYPGTDEGKDALLRLGRFQHEQKDYARAARYLGELRAGGVVNAEICYRLGDSYENLKDASKAMKAYASARKCRPPQDAFRIVALSQLAALYEQSDRLEEALGVYKDIAKNALEEQWRTAAAERIQLLRRYLNESGN